MKKTRWKNIIRNIKGNLNRFLSILFIVALGAGFMAGLAATSPDMYDAADKYIKEYGLFDIDIKSTIGFRDTDADTIGQLTSISAVQGARVFDMVLDQKDGTDFTSRIFGILDDEGQTDMNRFHLLEGRLPENENECVAESIFGKYTGESVRIGDILTLAEGNSNYDLLSGYMSGTELTVVGLCESPMCISIEGDTTNAGSGTINLNVYVKKDFFTCDFDTDIFIALKDSDSYNAFEDPYQNYTDSVIEEIRRTETDLAAVRLTELQESAADQISQLENLVSEISLISDIENQLDQDVQQRRLMNQELIDSDTLPGLSSYLSATETLLQDADTRFTPASDLAERTEKLLQDAREQSSQLEEAVWLYRTRRDLTGFDSYLNNVGKVSALARIFPVFFFVVALLVALTTMSRLIEENRLQIGTLKALGYSGGQILFEYMLFSFCASMLGCLLGFGVGFRLFPWAISSAYRMMYILPAIHMPVRWDIVAWVAPVTILSILLAALWSCWNEFRSMPAELMQPKAPAPGKRIWLEHIPFLWKRFSFNYKVTFRNLFRYKKRFIMTIIGVAGCSALLLTGFGVKDSVNDIIDKQFGELYLFDIMFAMDDENAIQEDPNLQELLENKSRVESYTTICQENGSIYFNGKKQELVLSAPQNPEVFPDYMILRSRTGHEHYDLTDDGVILTEKMCEEMGISAGDVVTLENSEGRQNTVTVIAIAENYVYSYAYMTTEGYQAAFGHLPQFSILLCKAAGQDEDSSETSDAAEHSVASDHTVESDNSKSSDNTDNPGNSDVSDKTMNSSISDLTAQVMKSPHILYGRSLESMWDSFSDSIQSINGVIYVLILSAGLLCIVVLYNLTNVNICERRKELATLKVLGFHKTETQNYIFRETNILSFLGALVGLVIGIWLHSFVVRTVEINHIMFGREIKPLSFVIALAISVVFTLIVDLIMKRPINKTDMVEAMKAND